jgi:leucyl aminopeptidase (aminopeptidase T)
MNAELDRRTFLGSLSPLAGALGVSLSPVPARAAASSDLSEIQMGRGALKILQTCASVKPGEEVLIVADYETERIGKVLAASAHQIGAEPVLVYLVPRDRDGQEPPKTVAEAMKKTQVFLAPVSRSITHTTAVKEAVAAGARGLLMTQFIDEMLVRGGIEEDFAAMAPVCKAIAQRFGDGRSVRMTSRLGTDLSFSINGRRGNAMTCLVGPGEFSPVPDIEANVAPVEKTASGRLVIDASVPYIGIGLLSEPMELRVEEGMVRSINGGAQARHLSAKLESFGDRLVYNIAELGVGLNRRSRMIGVMLEDEGVWGTAHIGIGTNITLGGTVKASCHYDLILWHPTIEIDGAVLIRDGEPQLPKPAPSAD